MSPDPTIVSEDFANQSAVVAAQPERSEVNGDINAGPPRRSAWNRPSNGVLLEPGSVMGGTNWPALSESTRSGMRSSSVDTSKRIADVSVSSSQAPHATTPPQSSSPRQANANNNINSPHSNPRPRNRGLGTTSSGSGPSHNNAPSQFVAFGAPYHVGTSVLDNPKTGPRPVLGVGVSQPHVGNDHSSSRNHSRRGGSNYGPWAPPRGEEQQYHNNHGGGRRDHDRRDVHHMPQYMAPPIGYMISPRPHAGPAFITSVFPGAVGYDMTPVMYSTMQAAVQAPLPPFYFTPSNENLLPNSILKQINYYFSDENLVKDAFLRQRMDENGWVPISLIASFHRVQNLTHDIPLILDSLRHSTVVEVQGDRIRRRNDWNRWLLSSGHPNNNSVSPSSSMAAAGSLQVQGVVSLNDESRNADHDAEKKKQQVSNGSS